MRQLRNQIDDVEQYGRHTSVRIHNVLCDSSDDCVDAVLDVLRNKMKVDVRAEDIDRCRPVGKPNNKNIKPIIVKFKSYDTKHAVYKAKSNLKGNSEKIFVMEDLTKRNHKMVTTLLQRMKAGLIHTFWTVYGKIYHKLSEGNKPQRALPHSDIVKPLSEPGPSAVPPSPPRSPPTAVVTSD